MSEKYSLSGRIDNFEFELIDAIKPVTSKPSGTLIGVKSGTLTWDGTTDLKLTGSLDVVGTPLLHNKYIRVYYVSTIPFAKIFGGVTWKTYRYLLGTCYADTESGHYENGKYSGTVSLRGTLARYLDDKSTKVITMGKGTKIVEFTKKVLSWYGGQYSITGLTDRKTSQPHVWDFGTSPYEIVATLAAFVNGYISCDRSGVLTISKYVEHAKRPVTYTYPTGSDSVTLSGIDIESTQGGAVNRVVVQYTKRETYSQNGKTKTRDVPIYGSASIDASNQAAKQKTGRYITYTEKLTSLKPETQKQANKRAKDILKIEGGYSIVYTVKSLFLPVSIGQVVHFVYDKIDVDAIILSIEYTLSPGCPMTVKMKRLRKH